MGVLELKDALEKGTTSSEELVKLFFDRYETYDRGKVRSVLQVDERALSQARALDEERRRTGARSPLHGIPILVKDNIDTEPPLETTAGSLFLLGQPPQKDAPVVEKLRRSGAIVVGKANLSEWSNFRSSYSLSGWSARGGVTSLPHYLDRNPSGSSSGSAAAVSAGLVPLSLGTETDGSIISPASTCGVVGVKPSVGFTSRQGVIPISFSQDTVGPMARSVKDAAMALSLIGGPDEGDPATLAFWDGFAFTWPLKEMPSPWRVGVLRHWQGRHPAVDRALEEAVAILRDRGVEVLDPVELPSWKALQEDESEWQVLLSEFPAAWKAYMEARTGEPMDLSMLLRFNEEHREAEMPLFGQDIIEKALQAPGMETEAYARALEKSRRLGGREGIDAALSAHRLHALLAPSGGPALLHDPILGSRGAWSTSGPAARAGYPMVTVPMGHVEGLPLGVSIIGTRRSEGFLLHLALLLEEGAPPSPRPRFQETLSWSRGGTP